MLKPIEQESLKLGDSTATKLKKLGKVLEDTREVSMQEVILLNCLAMLCANLLGRISLFKLRPQKNEMGY